MKLLILSNAMLHCDSTMLEAILHGILVQAAEKNGHLISVVA